MAAALFRFRRFTDCCTLLLGEIPRDFGLLCIASLYVSVAMLRALFEGFSSIFLRDRRYSALFVISRGKGGEAAFVVIISTRSSLESCEVTSIRNNGIQLVHVGSGFMLFPDSLIFQD